LKKSKRFPISARLRCGLLSVSALLLLVSFLGSTTAAAQTSNPSSNSGSATPSAESPWKYNAALNAFYQVTTSENGNFLRVDTTESLGGSASFRRPYRTWFGYEANYSFTRYSESYNKGTVARVQHGTNVVTIAYLLHTNYIYGTQFFATIGTGLTVISPTTNGGDGQSTQTLPVFVYSLGLDHPLLSDRLGIRVQYRALKYKTPSFGNVLLDSHTLRTTMEPSVGVYYRF
jgi:hypothetical protein